MTTAEQTELLLLARLGIEKQLLKEPPPAYSGDNNRLLRPSGAFVSLYVHDELRGCIGYIKAVRPLWETVVEMAQAAASRDFRFPTIRVDELDALEIEISVLTPLKKIVSIDEIQIGRHGLFIERRMQSGLLLPQVAVEHQWDRTHFLQHTCLKAGLDRDDWKDPETRIFVFSARVFSDRSTESI
ncbi:AmmeMemoRadiSam system protein A [candidate division KSB1 bacterium]|nr:AmmeMemoRadiSam system protein A [candidate division KSB1 bacterium]